MAQAQAQAQTPLMEQAKTQQMTQFHTPQLAVIVDPDCRAIVLHVYWKRIKVVPLDDKGQPQDPFTLKLKDVHELDVMDIKFLYGCKNPTIAVLLSPANIFIHKNEFGPDRYCCVRAYELSLEDTNFLEVRWTHDIGVTEADLLIPVPTPLGGVLVIGSKQIVYCGLSISISTNVKPRIKRFYQYRRGGFAFDDQKGIWSDHFHLAHRMVGVDVGVGGWRYLLSDHVGRLRSLVITSENEKATGLEIQLLRETFIASTISYIGNGLIYAGSRYGDSQLVKLNLQPDTASLSLEEVYMNLGPIGDFCVAHYERGRQGQVKVVTCSGTNQAGSLRIVSKKTQINELASANVEPIKGVWSLRLGTDDHHLVVSFVDETVILAMSVKEGDGQDTVMLVNTNIEDFCYEEPTLFCHDAINDQFVQVTSESVRLVSLTSRKLVHEWRPPSNYYINVATANATQVLLAASGNHLYYLEIGDGILLEKNSAVLQREISCLHIRPIGDIAAVGTWMDVCVNILSLPDLNLITKKYFDPKSIRPCSVLFCALEEICYLFCAVEDGHLFHFELDTSNKLQLTHMKEVSLGTQRLSLEAFSVKDRRHVFVACDSPRVIYSSNKKLVYSSVNREEVGHVCPFSSSDFPDDQTFQTLHSYGLADGEFGGSIVSCSFAGDPEEYYCVGTNTGHLIVFEVNGGRLEPTDRKRHSSYGINNLNAYKGGLFVTTFGKLLLMKWNISADGTRNLSIQSEYELPDHDPALQPDPALQIHGDIIMVYSKVSDLIMYQLEEGAIKEVARYNERMRSAFIVDDIYLGATSDCRLLTINGQKVGRECESHTDDYVNRFRQGSFVLQSGVDEPPTIIYGTERGAIGMIASLPKDQFTFMEMLQKSMRKVVKGIGGFSHEQWRNNPKKHIASDGFLDGDLLKSFLGLDIKKMTEISEMMKFPVEELRKRVEDLQRLY
ncbi:unnamed protein product [Lactuca virosa]|uniref:DNA damage-binding protein 1 n=1 Tax=Lactuca virosa TaxID=75947 RepID=A0AAU9LY92_9ASTR|nr:unnamed protein product [Lactuca virosa]